MLFLVLYLDKIITNLVDISMASRSGAYNVENKKIHHLIDLIYLK